MGGGVEAWAEGWVGSTTSGRMLHAPRSGIPFSLRKKEKREQVLLRRVGSQHGSCADSEFTHVDFNDGFN